MRGGEGRRAVRRESEVDKVGELQGIYKLIRPLFMISPHTLPSHPPSPSHSTQALVTSNSDKKSSASIAIFLASNGADLYLKNNKEQTPLDLCPDPHLLKLLTKCSMEYHKHCMMEPGTSSLNGTPVRVPLKVSSYIISSSPHHPNMDYVPLVCIICRDLIV